MKINFLSKLAISLCLITLTIIGCKKKEDTPDPTPKVATISSIVVSAEWLKDNLDATNILVIDARGGTDSSFATKDHIPGAIKVGMGQFDTPNPQGFNDLESASAFSTHLAALGINKNKAIVIYADNVSSWGADGRILWSLRMAGFNNTALLDGGINYWTTAGYPLTKTVVAPTPTTATAITYDSTYTATIHYVKNNFSTIKLLDSRAQTEYDGAQLYGEARGGHLVGATLLTYTNIFNADKRIKNQADLEAIFTAAGITKQDNIVTYCTAGFRSAHLAMILRYAGYTNARNYDGSFAEWAAADSTNYPVE